MYRFSRTSLANLETCHPDLQAVCNFVIRTFDFSVLDGHRDKETQDQYRQEGKSQLSWPNSKHNSKPSMAVDVAPYPIDWHNHSRFILLAGYMMMAAEVLRSLGIISYRLRWGGDWDMDQNPENESFLDLGHFELIST